MAAAAAACGRVVFLFELTHADHSQHVRAVSTWFEPSRAPCSATAAARLAAWVARWRRPVAVSCSCSSARTQTSQHVRAVSAGFEPPRAPCSRRKSPHANSCRPGHRSTWARPAEHDAVIKPHSICTICNCGGKWCCAARAPRCIAANASTRRAAAPKAAIGSPCPTSSVAMLMHDAMRQGEVVQHSKDCAAWWRTMPHACVMMSARRPQAQAECRKAARAAAAWPRRGRLRSWQARLSQLTWSRRANRRALYERNCESSTKCNLL